MELSIPEGHPGARKARAQWFSQDPELESSEVEVLLGKRIIQANLGSLQTLLGQSEVEEEEDSEEEVGSLERFAPPGGRTQKKPAKKQKQGCLEDVDVTQLMMCI